MHTFTSGWIYDTRHHWHEAACSCNLKAEECKGYAGHTLGEWSSPDSQGNKTRSCFCGYTDRSGHEHVYSASWSRDTEYHWHAAICAHTSEISGKAGHTYGGWRVTKAATETEKGLQEKECTECGFKKTEDIPVLSHTNHTAGSVWQKDGTNHWKQCTFNGCTQRMNEAGHTWNGVITTAPSCTASGVKTFTCTVCSAKKTESIAAAGHSYSESWSRDSTYHWHAAACAHTSLVSGKAEHTWDNGVITTPATCEAQGVKTFTCTVCSATRTESIAKNPSVHTYAEKWSTNSTYHWHAATCSHKSEISGKALHTLDEGTVTKEPTYITEGVKTYNCTVCGGKKTEVIPKKINFLLDKKINGVSISKTSEVEIITEPVTVCMPDNSAWKGYTQYVDVEMLYNNYKGVFIKDRSVTLSPFAMGSYEVTQDLYRAVLQNDSDCNAEPSHSSSQPPYGEIQGNRPVEWVTWYDAVYFCNALTKLVMSEEDCVYTITDITRNEFYNWGENDKGHITSATVTMDITKKGYRLPTEAEWEFAARGGNPDDPAWKYSYAGINTAGVILVDYHESDSALYYYGWYKQNSENVTHETGKKTPNSLALYDMNGNAKEWCWDWYGTVTADSSVNPTGPESGTYRIQRGGSYSDMPIYCSVSYRDRMEPYCCGTGIGFRLARSL